MRKRGLVARLDVDADDRYDNLILLCEDHLSAAAQTAGGSSTEHLAEIKAAHEEWVLRSPLAEHPTGSSVRYDPRCQGVTLLPRVRRGEALTPLLEGIHSIQYDQDEADGPGDQELVEGFLQYLQGVTDLWKEYDPAEKNRVAGHLDDQIDALERHGLLLFATRYTAEAGVAGAAGQWSILRIWILREGADSISAKG